MSDPLSNSEIQDVLSSIRRLVSEDRRLRTPVPIAEADGGELEAVVERASGDRGGGHGVHCGDPLARWVRAL